VHTVAIAVIEVVVVLTTRTESVVCALLAVEPAVINVVVEAVSVFIIAKVQDCEAEIEEVGIVRNCSARNTF